MFSKLAASMLYEKRFGPYFAVPLIAGIDAAGTPHIASMDCIGALTTTDNFLCAGTASETLRGACEAYWEPDMEPARLADVALSCLRAGMDRDALSGWGAEVIIITPRGVTAKRAEARQD
jgi:20S proteasome subunit beta 3